MNTTTLPKIGADHILSFDGVRDERYTFPIWSMMARNHRVYFAGDTMHLPVTFSSLAGHIEVLVMASEHRNNLKSD